MTRIHLFEFEDISWFPAVVREGMMDYLSFFMSSTHAYQPAVAVIRDLLTETNGSVIVDLGSGSGGDILKIAADLEDVKIILTDKYPNLHAFRDIEKKSDGRIRYVEKPVDASEVPGELKGLRTIFTAFHHFNRDKAAAVIKDAVSKGSSLAVFEGSDRTIAGSFIALLLIPVCSLFLCPFIRPFRLSRIIFTYLIPLIPLCTAWDGVISFMRLYSPAELLSLAKLHGPEFSWKAGKLTHPKFGFRIVYLAGHP